MENWFQISSKSKGKNMLAVLKGLSSKPCGKMIVAPNLCFLS
jgi:hypothetical protein